MRYGYARVSSPGQQKNGNSLDAQIELLKQRGAEVIVEECFTGRKVDRPKFTELLERHHKKEREIAFYADKMFITPKHLSQVIKDYSNKTALAFIEEYVIAEAKSMLLSTTLSIQQISDELNFPSQSVFGKYFKRVTGKSPTEYRRS